MARAYVTLASGAETIAVAVAGIRSATSAKSAAADHAARSLRCAVELAAIRQQAQP